MEEYGRWFKFEFVPTTITGVFLLILLFFGGWQLYRYFYLTRLLQVYQVETTQPPVNLQQALQHKDLHYKHVEASGYFLNKKEVILDRRMQDGQMGYEVITPFKVDHTDRILLVNRGWLPGLVKPTALPRVDTVPGHQNVTGYINLWDHHRFTLGPNIINDEEEYPLLVQKIDFNQLQRVMHMSLYPFVLQLDKDQSYGFSRNWTPIATPPQSYLAHAIQAFAIALVVLIAYLIYGFRQAHIAQPKPPFAK